MFHRRLCPSTKRRAEREVVFVPFRFHKRWLPRRTCNKETASFFSETFSLVDILSLLWPLHPNLDQRPKRHERKSRPRWLFHLRDKSWKKKKPSRPGRKSFSIATILRTKEEISERGCFKRFVVLSYTNHCPFKGFSSTFTTFPESASCVCKTLRELWHTQNVCSVK